MKPSAILESHARSAKPNPTPPCACLSLRRRSYVDVKALLAVVAFLGAGCSRDLTRSEADRIVTENPKAAGVTPVATEGISKTSESEAITKTRIGEEVFNLKFRRYDKDWKWEFVETKGGGWLAAEELLDQLQEKQRLKRVDAWAASHMDAYATTIEEMDHYSDDMPRRTDMPMDFSSWNRIRRIILPLYKSSVKTDTDPKRRAALEKEIKRIEEGAFDAWGTEILLHFDNSNRTAVFVSLGPDKPKGTDDDVICSVSGRRGWDDSRDEIMWDYTKEWQLPEGLQPAIDKTIEEPADRRAIFVRTVK